MKTRGIEAYTVETCMKRLKQVREDAEKEQSLRPVQVFFDGLTAYIRRHNPDKIALQNWARFHSLWQAHMDSWYLEFQKKVRDEKIG